MPITGAGSAAESDGVVALLASLSGVLPVNAPSGDSTGVTDSARIQAAIDAASTAGGGVVSLRAGTYYAKSLLIKTGVTVAGAGVGATTVKLPTGANVDLVTVPSFSSLTGTDSQGGESQFGFRDLTLDGNGANQSGTSWTFRVYGKNYRMRDVEIVSGYSGNVFSEWSSFSGGDMEAVWDTFKVRNAYGKNIDWNGPHDSIFTNGEVVSLSGASHSTYGIHTRGHAAGETFTSVHVWGYHDYGWVLEHSATARNCAAEGARTVNVMALVSNITWDGAIFGTNDTHTGETGLQLGDATHTGLTGVTIRADFSQFGATSSPIYYYSSGGFNRVEGKWTRGTGPSVIYTGTLDTRDTLDVICTDDHTKTISQLGRGLLLIGYSGDPPALQVRQSGATVFLIQPTGGIVAVTNGAAVKGYSDLAVTQTFSLSGSDGSVQPGTVAGVGAKMFSGSGAPTISATAGDFYLRTGTPTTANQRLYICTGTTNWTGIL